ALRKGNGGGGEHRRRSPPHSARGAGGGHAAHGLTRGRTALVRARIPGRRALPATNVGATLRRRTRQSEGGIGEVLVRSPRGRAAGGGVGVGGEQAVDYSL